MSEVHKLTCLTHITCISPVSNFQLHENPFFNSMAWYKQPTPPVIIPLHLCSYIRPTACGKGGARLPLDSHHLSIEKQCFDNWAELGSTGLCVPTQAGAAQCSHSHLLRPVMHEHISTWLASRLDIVLRAELVQPTSTKGTVLHSG